MFRPKRVGGERERERLKGSPEMEVLEKEEPAGVGSGKGRCVVGKRREKD